MININSYEGEWMFYYFGIHNNYGSINIILVNTKSFKLPKNMQYL